MHYRLFRRRERKRSKKCTSEHYGWNLSKPKEGNISRYRKHVHACSICVTLCNPLDDSLPGSPSVQEFPRQECRNGLPFPTPVDLPDLMIEPASPALAGRFFITVSPEVQRVPKQNECKQTHSKTYHNETGKSGRENPKDNTRKSYIQGDPYKASPNCRIYAGQKGAA